MSSPSRAPGSTRPGPTSCSCASSGSARPCSATTWGSWGATRPCRPCARRSSSARRMPTRSCSSSRAELCTLHLRTSNDPDTIVASSLFADGAAAGIVTSRAARRGGARLRPRPLRDAHHAGRRGRHGVEDRRPRVRDGALQRDAPRSSTSTSRARSSRCSTTTPRSPRRSPRMPRATRSSTGRSTRAGAASSTRWSRGCSSPRRSSCRPARRCATTATCRAPRCCSCCATSSTSDAAADGDRVVAMAFGPGLTVESALMTVRA